MIKAKIRRFIKKLLGIKSPSKELRDRTIGKGVQKETADDGIRITVDAASDAFNALSIAAKKAETGLSFWAENRVFETFTPNEMRELFMEPQILTETDLEEREFIRCEYCGRINEKKHRICDGCGAVL